MIKKISILMLIFSLLSITTYSQITNKQLYEHKVESYNSVKKAGGTLLGLGALVTAGGILLISSADWETQTDYYGNTSKTTDEGGKLVGGIFMIIVGGSGVITGIVLAAVGSNKSKEYQEKLNRLNVGLNYKPHNKGLVLSYRF